MVSKPKSGGWGDSRHLGWEGEGNRVPGSRGKRRQARRLALAPSTTRKLGLSAIPPTHRKLHELFPNRYGWYFLTYVIAAVLPVVISLSLVLRAGKVTSRGLLRSPSQAISRLAQAILPGNLLQTAARSTPLRRLQVPL